MTEWPKGVVKPAIRALNAAGYTELKQLVQVDVATLKICMVWGQKRLLWR